MGGTYDGWVEFVVSHPGRDEAAAWMAHMAIMARLRTGRAAQGLGNVSLAGAEAVVPAVTPAVRNV